jgi:ribosomal protein S18 acetylase RimI-like enzyme
MAGCDGIVALRQAKESDARGIAEVHVSTWRSAYRGLVPQPVLDSLSVDNRERFWRQALAVTSANRTVWVALSDGEIVGFVSSGPSGDLDATSHTGEIYAIYVGAECWDRGVGRNLLAHAERDLKSHGYSQAGLWVLSTNERARQFYEAAGWRADGTEKTDIFGGAELHESRYAKTFA